MSICIKFESSHPFVEQFCVLVPNKRTYDYHEFQDEVRRVVNQACADMGEFREEWDHSYLDKKNGTYQVDYGTLARNLEEYEEESMKYAVSAMVIQDCVCYRRDCEWCNLITYTTIYEYNEDLLEEFHAILNDQFNSPPVSPTEF